MNTPADLTVIEALPVSGYYPAGEEETFRRLAGATIVRIGAPAEDGIEGSGLIIDYTLPNSNEIKRVVFAFTELGMWIEWQGQPTKASSQE